MSVCSHAVIVAKRVSFVTAFLGEKPGARKILLPISQASFIVAFVILPLILFPDDRYAFFSPDTQHSDRRMGDRNSYRRRRSVSDGTIAAIPLENV